MILFPKNFIQALVLLFLGLLFTLPIFILKEIYRIEVKDEILDLLIYLLVFISICLFYFWKNRKNISLGHFFSSGIKLPLSLSILTFLFVLIFSFGVDIPLAKLIAFNFGGENKVINPFTNIPLLLGAILAGPILEEIVFRGMIFRGFLQTYSVQLAIFLSALLFSLIHVLPHLLFGAFIFGLFSSYLFYISKNIWLVIILHVIANLIGIFGSHYLSNSSIMQYIGEANSVPMFALILLSSLMCIFLVLKIKKMASVYLN